MLLLFKISVFGVCVCVCVCVFFPLFVKVVAVSGSTTYILGVQMNPLTWKFFFL
jgi:hypothetical protein